MRERGDLYTRGRARLAGGALALALVIAMAGPAAAGKTVTYKGSVIGQPGVVKFDVVRKSGGGRVVRNAEFSNVPSDCGKESYEIPGSSAVKDRRFEINFFRQSSSFYGGGVTTHSGVFRGRLRRGGKARGRLNYRYEAVTSHSNTVCRTGPVRWRARR